MSCQDVLVEKPKSVAVETFYNTAGEIETAVNAIYTPLKSNGAFGELYPAQLEAYTDYSYGRGSYTFLSEFQGLDGTNLTRTGQIWDQLYLAIRNANLVINNAPKGSKISKEDIEKFVGEAKFLRALAYFHLVRNWGKVVLRTENNMNEQDLPLTQGQEVYKLIEEDLLYAESTLPSTAPVPGRASKWAAKSVLADVYFNQNKYKEAREKSEEVINSNSFQLVPVKVAEDFQKIYGPEVITTPEEVFYFKFNRVMGWNFVFFAHHPGNPYFNGAGYYAHYTDSEKNTVFKNWDNKDLRKEHDWFNYNIGLGTTSMLNRKFRDPGRISSAANDYPLYRYADILLLFAEAECYEKGGPTENAIAKLNMVRRRAYGYDAMTASPVDFKLSDYTLETFVDLVIRERGYETQYEGKRWLDLRRSGKVKQIIKAAVDKEVADKHLLWPIPVSELNFNNALDPKVDQNLGY